jgi:hypothetical protein
MSEPNDTAAYVRELKLWAIRAAAVIVTAAATVLLQRWGVPVEVPAPPVTVVIEPPRGTGVPLDEFKVKLIQKQ